MFSVWFLSLLDFKYVMWTCSFVVRCRIIKDFRYQTKLLIRQTALNFIKGYIRPNSDSSWNEIEVKHTRWWCGALSHYSLNAIINIHEISKPSGGSKRLGCKWQKLLPELNFDLIRVEIRSFSKNSHGVVICGGGGSGTTHCAFVLKMF